MNHALMRSQPAILRMIGDLAEDRAKVCHDFFDFTPCQRLGKFLDRRTDQVVARSQRKGKTGASEPVLAM